MDRAQWSRPPLSHGQDRLDVISAQWKGSLWTGEQQGLADDACLGQFRA